ncbi:MAG: hypothetical protein FJZ98_07645 [Chloroflexi bacterium]|nr:hypothetical protein [Chloroflexota bacterium]
MEKKQPNYYSYMIGGLVGAVIGMIAAYLIVNSPELSEGENPFNSKKLTRLGLGTVSILWGLIHPGKGQ